VNEISFNTALIKELRAIALMQQIVDGQGDRSGRGGADHIHLIHTDVEVQDLAASSKMNAEWPICAAVRTRPRLGRDLAGHAHFDRIGRNRLSIWRPSSTIRRRARQGARR
jgi:NTE family protein